MSAVRDRDFTFVNYGPPGKDALVKWGYTFEAHGEETTVTESWQVLPAYPKYVTSEDPDADVARRLDGMAKMAKDGIRDTLAALKESAES